VIDSVLGVGYKGNNCMELIDIKRCRRTLLDTQRYRMSSLIVPLLYPHFSGNYSIQWTEARFIDTNPSNEAMTSGLPVIRPQSRTAARGKVGYAPRVLVFVICLLGGQS
jgi:hypothetical protein